MAKQDNETTYKLNQELQALPFPEKPIAKEFIERLPKMSAIELMFAMNERSERYPSFTDKMYLILMKNRRKQE